MPTKSEHPPVALFLAGSGATSRDGNSGTAVTNDAYKILAHRLTLSGIASVRFDKRGVGESIWAAKSELSLRFDDYIDDAKAWVDTLRASHRFSRIIVIGHSEGSLVGLAACGAADKCVSIAGAGRTIDQVLKEQLKDFPNPLRDSAYAVLDSLAVGRRVPKPPKRFLNLLRPSVQPYMISWIKHSPQSEIKALKIPVLILQGTKDIQISVEDAKLLAAANPKARLVLIEGMNHVFRLIAGDIAENRKSYFDAALPISDQLVHEIAAFINAR